MQWVRRSGRARRETRFGQRCNDLRFAGRGLHLHAAAGRVGRHRRRRVDQLDLNVAYNITADWTVTAAVLNATKSELRSYIGNDSQARLLSNLYAGRQLYFGVNWKF